MDNKEKGIYIEKIKEEITRRIRDYYGENLVSIVYYGPHLEKEQADIDVLVIINEPYDPVKVNRIADFIENIRDPIEEEYGVHLLFDLYTREEAENFHTGYIDIARRYEVVYDKNGYFSSLIKEMSDPSKALKHVQYLTTIDYIQVDEPDDNRDDR